jgi:hypothetical protein
MEEFLETIWDDLYFFVLALSAGGRQLVGPPGGGRAGAAVSPPGWGVRAAEKLGAAALPWCAVVPSADQSGRRPGGLVGCASRVVASAIRSRPVVLASYSAVSACATSVGWDERGAGDPVFWMGGGETDADGQHCLRADSAVFEGEGVQLGQQDEEFFPACFELISGRCDSDARRCGSG